MTQLIYDEAADNYPLWTLDGKRIVFQSDREGSSGIYWIAADGTGDVEPLGSAVPTGESVPFSWSSDGKTLILQANGRTEAGQLDIEAISMEGDNSRYLLLHEKHNESQPQISPKGRWMAYTSDESGQNEVYVRSFPVIEDGVRWQISTDGGDNPFWSQDGQELFYRCGNAIMAVTVELEPTFAAGQPKFLFRKPYVSPDLAEDQNSWTIHPDGKRFLMMKRSSTDEFEDGALRKINIVLNWFEELKERVPTN
jgi:Tol biopolymer transport system component